MKGICFIWSRGRHFYPSLPDRGPTGIRHLAHSISDPRAEMSAILVMVRRSSCTSRGTSYWLKYFFCFEFRVFGFALAQFFSTEMFTIIKKNDAPKGIEETARSFRGPP